MSATAAYTDELVAKFDLALADTVAAGPDGDPLAIFEAHGVGLVDLARRTFLIDRDVYESVCFRLQHERRQRPPHLIVDHATWRSLTP